MANWNTLKTAVAGVINANGSQAITGQLLQNVLNNIITNVGENATFAGIATLDTNPGAPDGPVFYLATTAGTYPNFNGIEVQDGEVVIFLWNNNAWSKKVTGFAIQEQCIKNYGGGSLIARDKFSEVGIVVDDGTIFAGLNDWVSCPIYIKCKPNTTYYYGSSPQCFIFYDENKNSIGARILHATNQKGNVTSPLNTRYVRFSTYPNLLQSENLYFSETEENTEYPLALTNEGKQLSIKSIGGLEEIFKAIKGSINNQINSFGVVIEYSNNLFIKDDILIEGYLGPTGQIIPSFSEYGWKSSENYVPCLSDTEYIVERDGQLAVVLYDENFNFISQQLDVDSFSTPSNAKYIKFSSVKKGHKVYNIDTPSGEVENGTYPLLKLELPYGLPLLTNESEYKKTYKIATLGDSITYRGQYQEIIEKYLNYSFFNNGLSGRSMGYFPFLRKSGTSSDAERLLVSSDFEGIDAIIICGYANDLWHKLGTMNDSYVNISQEGLDIAGSINGYVRQIEANGYIPSVRSVIEYIIKICPNIPILLSGQLPMSRPKESWDGATDFVDFHREYNGSGATCVDFSDALKSVAEYYSIPYVDMERNGQVNIFNYTNYYTGTDTTHPNYIEFDSNINDFPNSGMKRMAILLMDGLKKVLFSL